jgi:hypothetical protein
MTRFGYEKYGVRKIPRTAAGDCGSAFSRALHPDNPPYAQDGVREAGSIVIIGSWDVLFLESLRGLHQKRRDERERCYCVDAASSRPPPHSQGHTIVVVVWTEYCIANSPIASPKVVLFPMYPAITAVRPTAHQPLPGHAHKPFHKN